MGERRRGLTFHPSCWVTRESAMGWVARAPFRRRFVRAMKRSSHHALGQCSRASSWTGSLDILAQMYSRKVQAGLIDLSSVAAACTRTGFGKR